MNLIKCNNGHYYDGDKYTTCPHCNKSKGTDDDVTVNMELTNNTQREGDEKPNREVAGSVSLKAAVGEAVSYVSRQQSDDDLKTVSFYSGKMGSEPVVGWLVCIDGNAKGKGYELKAGKNFIGRSSSMDIVLNEDSSVSRERHAVVIYEPKSRKFIAQPGESRELFYLNDGVVLENIEMKLGDELLVGNTSLKFVPFCGSGFGWE